MKKIFFFIITLCLLVACNQSKQDIEVDSHHNTSTSQEEIISNIESYLKNNSEFLTDFMVINEDYIVALFDQSVSIKEPKYKIEIVNVKDKTIEDTFQNINIQYRFYGTEVILLKTIDNGFYFYDGHAVNIYTIDSKEIKKIDIDSPSLDMYTTPCITVSNDGSKLAYTKTDLNNWSDSQIILNDLSNKTERIIWSTEQHPHSQITNLSFNLDGNRIYFSKEYENHDYYGSISLNNLDYEENQLDDLLFFFEHGNVLLGGNENLYTNEPSRKDIISLSENPLNIQATGNNESMQISMNGLGNAFITTSYILGSNNEFIDFTKKLYIDNQLISTYTPKDMNKDGFKYGDFFLEEVDTYRHTVYIIIYSKDNEIEVITLNY